MHLCFVRERIQPALHQKGLLRDVYVERLSGRLGRNPVVKFGFLLHCDVQREPNILMRVL
jgi:hypothetical protein